MVIVKDVIDYLEGWAPKQLQENYDNAGLICGDVSQEVQGIITTLDCTEKVVEEAIEKKANLIVAHHPIIFKGLNSLTGKTYVERTILKAIKNEVAIFASHTNLDNVPDGVNAEIGDRLGILQREILKPIKGCLTKLVFYTPKQDSERVLEALFAVGAGQIGNYSACAFRQEGRGSFTPNNQANPTIGAANAREYVEETKAEVLVTDVQLSPALAALKNAHPYEEVAYDLIPLLNEHPELGAGMIGDLEQAMEPDIFLHHLKSTFHTKSIKYTTSKKKKIKRVAWCGGSGQFLLSTAIAKGADAFVTGDIKYHEFFDADEKIMLCDIGHYESEQFTKDLLKARLSKNFPNIAVWNSDIPTNPVHYFT